MVLSCFLIIIFSQFKLKLIFIVYRIHLEAYVVLILFDISNWISSLSLHLALSTLLKSSRALCRRPGTISKTSPLGLEFFLLLLHQSLFLFVNISFDNQIGLINTNREFFTFFKQAKMLIVIENVIGMPNRKEEKNEPINFNGDHSEKLFYTQEYCTHFILRDGALIETPFDLFIIAVACRTRNCYNEVTAVKNYEKVGKDFKLSSPHIDNAWIFLFKLARARNDW